MGPIGRCLANHLDTPQAQRCAESLLEPGEQFEVFVRARAGHFNQGLSGYLALTQRRLFVLEPLWEAHQRALLEHPPGPFAFTGLDPTEGFTVARANVHVVRFRRSLLAGGAGLTLRLGGMRAYFSSIDGGVARLHAALTPR